MKAELLIEVFCEELPAIPFLKEKDNILDKWNKCLESYGLASKFDFYYTPRRLVLISQDFPLKQEDTQQELFGPPLSIAYADGNPDKGLSPAGLGFLKKCGLAEADSLMDVGRESLQVRDKDGKPCLFFSQRIEGKESASLLQEMIESWLKSLHFGKSMRWGSLQDSFIRPIRNIALLLDGKPIPITLFGLQSLPQTWLHRDFGFEPRGFESLAQYHELLANGGVILDPRERERRIREGLDQIERERGVEIEMDAELLAEIVAITEHPTALYGSFDVGFLQLPPEVIITSMRENQRYFALYETDSDTARLHNGFVCVSNSTAKEQNLIIQGNEKVLRARLSDALFFYQNDLKKPLESYDLSKIAFVEGLGTMQDKVDREMQIARHLLQGSEHSEEVLEAIRLSKQDLLTEIVGEFPELQGTMGRHYALHQSTPSHSANVARAIQEQYLPNGENSPLPSHSISAFVALSFRLDGLFALFSIGKIPSGSKDPYGLRRAGNAVLKILQAYPAIRLGYEDLSALSKLYRPFDLQILWEFLLERMEGVLKVNPSIIRSIIKGREKELSAIMDKSLALSQAIERADKEKLLSAFKRVANISTEAPKTRIDPTLFQLPEEQRLHEETQKIKAQNFANISETIASLFGISGPLEEFFEKVLVNDKDEAIRENRKALIYEIYTMFLEVGDIKEISI